MTEHNCHTVRKIVDSTGIIYSIPGLDLLFPWGIALALGDIYVADTHHHRIQKYTASSNLVTTIAGTGEASYNGDGVATSAALFYPSFLTFSSGNVFITDTSNNRVRKVTVSTGIITTIAGTGSTTFSGDNGAATSATLYFPSAVALDASGRIL